MLFSRLLRKGVEHRQRYISLTQVKPWDKNSVIKVNSNQSYHLVDVPINYNITKSARFNNPFLDFELNESMGGEIAELIRYMKGKVFNCIGNGDGHCETVGSWFGYEHMGGISDGSGTKWWVYQKCSKTSYNVAWWKVVRLLKFQRYPKLTISLSDFQPGKEKQTQSENMLTKKEKDYYHILAVSTDAQSHDIARNYRYLVKRFHPDIIEGDKVNALETLKLLNEAYEVLSDPAKRSLYDKKSQSSG